MTQKKSPPKREVKKRYKQIESEQIRQQYEGTTIISKQGYEVRLNKYNDASNCELEFLNVKFPYKINIEIRSFKNKTVRYPYHPSKYGVGYIGIGKFIGGSYSKENIIYDYWDGILRRCYSERIKKLRNSYSDCLVDEYWHNLQNFGEWFEKNYNPKYMKSWCLDKDILVKGNRIYSPETCCFVPNEINVIFTNGYIRRGEYPKGVSYKPKINKYIAQYQKDGVVTHIGTFKTVDEAFQAYKEVKEKYIKEKADKWKDQIDTRVYEAMYNYQVEITD